MNEIESEWIEQTRELAGKLAPYVNKDLIDRLLLVYTLENDEKEKVRQEIDSLMDEFSHQVFLSKKPLLECPSREESFGEIKIGKVMSGNKTLWDFGLKMEETLQHLLITGRSGCGKSTLIVQIIKELLRGDIPFLVFDYKLDYRALIRVYPQILVLNWKEVRINPLEPPPHVSFQEWKQQFLNIFGHVQGVWHGSTQYLLEAIDKVYEEKRAIPTIEEVYKKVVEANETSRKMQEYASVIETRLYGLLGKLKETINNRETLLDLEKLLEMPVVLELHGLGKDEATLIALWFFYWIYAYRRAKGIRGKLLHVLIIDEAKRIFTASEQYSQTTTEYSGIPPADLICDEIRDFGEGIIASDQEPTKLSNSLKANTYTKITGFLGNGKDVNDIAEAMDLNEEERDAITQLERGEWLVKLAGRYTKPFMIKTEDFPLKKDVTDEEIKQRMKPVLEKIRKHPEEAKAVSSEKVFLSDEAYRLLLNVNEHPFNGISARQKELDISATRLEKAKQELITKGFIQQLELALGGRRPTAFLVLTKEGIRFLESRGIDTRLWAYIGRVSFEHMLYQTLIRWYLQKLGYDAHLEVNLGNRRFDVLASNSNRKLAFEIELDASADVKQKLEGIEAIDRLYIVTRKNLFYAIKSKINPIPQKVRLYSIEVLLEKLRYSVKKYSETMSFSQNKPESSSFKQNKIVSSSKIREEKTWEKKKN
jgi:energy-coupling factor transporter ATP-binding protein EcfA2